MAYSYVDEDATGNMDYEAIFYPSQQKQGNILFSELWKTAQDLHMEIEQSHKWKLSLESYRLLTSCELSI